MLPEDHKGLKDSKTSKQSLLFMQHVFIEHLLAAGRVDLPEALRTLMEKQVLALGSPYFYGADTQVTGRINQVWKRL